MNFENLNSLFIRVMKRHLSNKVLNIDFGQEAAKISEVKVGGQKKISDDQPSSNPSARGWLSRQILFSTSNFDL